MAEKKSFEKTMAELEATVKALEDGNATLDEALSLFEKGFKGLPKDFGSGRAEGNTAERSG